MVLKATSHFVRNILTMITVKVDLTRFMDLKNIGISVEYGGHTIL
jgi:hypothetical protein